MRLWDIYKAIKVGRSDSLFASVVGNKLNKDAWKKGFNKWDEEWEIGSIKTDTGEKVRGDNTIRSKNHIPVIPGQNYFIKSAGNNEGIYGLYKYDAEKGFIGIVTYNSLSNHIIEVPSDCAYLMFRTYAAYGTTYKNDICINISGEHDGEYVPYNG